MGSWSLGGDERFFRQTTYNCVYGGSFTHLDTDRERRSKTEAKRNELLRVAGDPVSLLYCLASVQELFAYTEKSKAPPIV